MAINKRHRYHDIIILLTMFFIYFAFLSLCFGNVETEHNIPIVVLISFDGFRWDYLFKTKTHTLTWLAKNGVSAIVKNNFVTRTFPNHYSMVTGMYEERHGIISNYMYDPLYNETFNPQNTESKWFNASEPIWITNEKQGGGKLSSTPIQGRMANFSHPYNRSIPFRTRIDMILNQLDKKQPANFLAAYFEEPDATGHKHGPDSEQIIGAIKKVDNIAGYLVKGLEKRNLFDKVSFCNLILEIIYYLILEMLHYRTGTCNVYNIFAINLLWLMVTLSLIVPVHVHHVFFPLFLYHSTWKL